MSIQDPATQPMAIKGFMAGYLESLSLVERLHRLLLDVIKDEFERVGVLEINAVQALLLFNIGDNEVTAGELKSRGYYQGSNVSYNLKMLVKLKVKGEDRQLPHDSHCRYRAGGHGGKPRKVFAIKAFQIFLPNIVRRILFAL